MGTARTSYGAVVRKRAIAFRQPGKSELARFGPINVNGGTLSVVGPGGVTHPTGLGAVSGPRNITLNGATFSVVRGDYDPSPAGVSQMQFVVGAAGGA